MKRERHLITVGGTGRNVGKTEFVCRLIAKMSRSFDVFGLKVSAMFPDELLYHGDHSDIKKAGQMFEELRTDTKKDTSRMLRAGARRVFFLRCDEKDIPGAYEEFRRIIPSRSIVVCESNSLDEFIHPGLRIMVKAINGKIKKRAVKRLQDADMVVISDGKGGFPELDQIQYSHQSGWQIAG